MIFQPHLFFADIDLFYIINKLLFQPVVIIIFFAYIFFQQFGNTFPYFLLAKRFQFDHFFLLFQNIIDPGYKVFFQDFPSSSR